MRFVVEFFDVAEKNGENDFIEYINNICGVLPNLSDRIVKIENQEYQFSSYCLDDSDILFGWIRKIITEHPKSAGRNEANEYEIRLSNDQELVVRSYFLYNKNKNILLMQRTSTGPGKGILSKYLVKIGKENLDPSDRRRFSFIPHTDPTLLVELQNAGVFKSLQITPRKNINQINNELQMSEIANNRVFKAAQIFTDVDSEFIIKNFNRGLLKEVFGCIDSEIRFKDFSDYYDKVIVTIKDKDDTKQKSINFNKLFKKVIIYIGTEKTVSESDAKTTLLQLDKDFSTE